MRRRRQPLQVSTFPFLAVLLCAMGALILLMLVLDRRAKVVAQVKARQAAAARQQAREDDEARAAEAARLATAARTAADEAARHAAEVAAREAARRAAERRAVWAEQSRLRQEGLKTEVQAVRQRAAELAGRQAQARTAANTEKERLAELLRLLASDRQEMEDAGREEARAAQEAAGHVKDDAGRRAEAARLAERLALLQAALAQVKAARERDAHTYSLVPYQGRRGESRRPLYIECAARGIIFHPDRQTLNSVAVTPEEIRREVLKRVQGQRAGVVQTGGKPEARAYLMLLVRPDAVPLYYAVIAALKGEEIDFGYEFIDRNWVLDFPEEGRPAAQPWMAGQSLPAAALQPPSGPTRSVRGLGQGGQEGAAAEGTGRDEDGSAGGGSAPGRFAPGTVGSTGNTAAVRTGSGGGLPALPGSVDGAAGSSAVTIGTPAGLARGASGAIPVGRSSGVPGGFPGGADGAGAGDAPGGVPGVPALGRPEGIAGVPGGVNPGSGVRGAPGGVLDGGPGEAGGPAGTSSGVAGVSLGPPGPQGGTAGPPPTDGTAGDNLREVLGGPPVAPRGAAGSGGTGSVGVGTPPAGGPAGQPAAAPAAGLPPLPWEQAVPRAGSGTGTASSQSPGPRPADAPAAEGPAGPALPAPTTGADRAGSPAAGAGGGSADSGPGNAGGGGGVGEPAEEGAVGGGRSLPEVLPVRPTRPASAANQPRPFRLIGNRDWVIQVECTPSAVVLRPLGQSFPLASFEPQPGQEPPLLQALRTLISRRQAGVRPGDPPYRPQVRFLIHKDGLRAYHLAYPALRPLGVPLTRQNAEPRSEDD